MSARICKCCGRLFFDAELNLPNLCKICASMDTPEDTYDPKEEAQADYSLAKDDEDLKQRGVL